MLTGWRTLIASALIAVFGVLQGMDWITIISNPAAFGWTAAGLAIVMAIFRSITATPPTKADAIESVNANPNVAGVITTNTPEGRAIAGSITSSTVAVAGTADAAKVAQVKS